MQSPIGDAQAALMSRHVSIIVSSRDERHRPHLMRAVGCRLSDDRRRVTLLMPGGSGDPVLADLRTNGRIAVVFSEPSSNLTVQVKGTDAVVSPVAPGDQALAEAYLLGFIEEIGQLGFSADVARTILAYGQALQRIDFSVSEAFEQTPGPAAGQRLGTAPAIR